MERASCVQSAPSAGGIAAKRAPTADETTRATPTAYAALSPTSPTK